MATLLRIPTECIGNGESFNELLDIARDIGAHVTWGIAPQPRHRVSTEKVWVAVHSLPGQRRVEMLGTSLNTAALAILCAEWPDPSDLPGDEAG